MYLVLRHETYYEGQPQPVTQCEMHSAPHVSVAVAKQWAEEAKSRGYGSRVEVHRLDSASTLFITATQFQPSRLPSRKRGCRR